MCNFIITGWKVTDQATPKRNQQRNKWWADCHEATQLLCDAQKTEVCS